MSKAIFRKVSLERLSSPEELDQLITVTRPGGWIALLGLILILTIGVIWAFVGNIPVKVTGAGMITSSEGVAAVIHPVTGRVIDVTVRPGDYVRKGDVLARVEPADLVDKINMLQRDVELARSFDASLAHGEGMELSANLNNLYDLAAQLRQAQGALELDRSREAANLEQTFLVYEQAELSLEQHRHNAAVLEENLQLLHALYEEGIIPRNEYDEGVNELAQAMNRVEIAEAELSKIRARARTLDSPEELNILYLRERLEMARAVAISEITRKLEQAQHKLESYALVVAQAEGRILEVAIEKGHLIQAGASVASIIRGDRTVNTLEVVLYVSPEEGKQITPGMDAHISPTIVKKEDYGYLLGKVISVSEYPVTSQTLIQALGSRELADFFSGGGAPIEVRVHLIPDPSTTSGLKWSTAQGPPLKIDSGNICTGSIVIETKRPVELVIPALTRILN